MSGYKGHNNLHVLDAFANEEVPALDMLHAPMMLRVVGHRNARLVIHREVRRGLNRIAEVGHETSKVKRLLGGLRARHDLGLAR